MNPPHPLTPKPSGLHYNAISLTDLAQDLAILGLLVDFSKESYIRQMVGVSTWKDETWKSGTRLGVGPERGPMMVSNDALTGCNDDLAGWNVEGSSDGGLGRVGF